MWDETKEKVDTELKQLTSLLEKFERIFNKIAVSEPDAIELSALAAMLHAFYNGCENIFKRIAVEIDHSFPDSPTSHRDLLLQMGNATSVRPAVISLQLLFSLTEYLNFRHVFRHAYTFDLNWQKMSPLVNNCKTIFKELAQELDTFFNK
jgi:hypothetical protein